ncbi:hypothetical protein [Sinorhizobium alkalisoli]|uniref:PE-PGRS family protein n=1 Tax=Sinorhizobium alkalisoli TaxID=1752398 RepID=A0A1E3VAA4_9HYPH|nr:hypothetical protein [Sinorhizobium alkalisoli]ODR90415.1 hypothetical protein A8M32_13825 [Sinorhizobium alkalisoli]
MADSRPLSDDAPNTNTDQSSVAAGHLALVPTWLPLDFAGDSGQNAAGNGGDGTSFGIIGSNTLAMFVPSNMAIAGPQSNASAEQGNNALIYQHATEMAGIGGDGGSGNQAIGSVGNSNLAGNGGNGTFFGSLLSTDVAVFAPVNTAVAAGPGSTATAEQTNNAAILQGATQVGGVGGAGGDHNSAGGAPAASAGATFTFTGDNYAGHGGDGTFIGSMVDVNVAVFSPINIAVGAAGGNAQATQTNNVIFDQGGVQIAGIGGNGGGFNFASDTIFTGNAVGDGGGGGTGTSTGSMVDVNIGYFHPINIAVPAGGTAEADQLNHVLYDQHTLQLGGVGGAGGEGNIADANSALVDDVLALVNV